MAWIKPRPPRFPRASHFEIVWFFIEFCKHLSISLRKLHETLAFYVHVYYICNVIQDNKLRKKTMENSKTKFLEEFARNGGVLKNACLATGISHGQFYAWKKSDPEFAAAADEVVELQLDYVEDQLLRQIEAGSTSATTFYLKTRGKRRGWNEKHPLTEDAKTSANIEELQRLKSDAVEKLTAAVKAAGGDVKVFAVQIDVTSTLWAQAQVLAKTLAGKGDIIESATTREGMQRQHVDPHFSALMTVIRQLQFALRGLGLNADSKELKGPDEFLQKLEDLRNGD